MSSLIRFIRRIAGMLLGAAPAALSNIGGVGVGNELGQVHVAAGEGFLERGVFRLQMLE